MDEIRLDSFQTSEGVTKYTLQFVNMNGNVILSETFDTVEARALRIEELESESEESGG